MECQQTYGDTHQNGSWPIKDQNRAIMKPKSSNEVEANVSKIKTDCGISISIM